MRRAPFKGDRAVEAGLTWSQQEIWALIEKAAPHDHVYNVVEEFRVPPGVRPTEDECLDALSFLLSRHESLRSVFPAKPGGRVVQRVLTEGELPVEFVDTPTTTGEEIAALKAYFATRRFAFADELPCAWSFWSPTAGCGAACTCSRTWRSTGTPCNTWPSR